MRQVSRFILELANVPSNRYQPFVGRSAFAHKGGVHISAVEKNPKTYEHIDPGLVGNKRRILISDLSGRAAIKQKAEEFGLKLSKTDPVAMQVLEELKELENQGFQFEAAEASFELLINKTMGTSKKYFELVSFRVIDQKQSENKDPVAEATIQIRVGGQLEHTAALGNGPVNALDKALRKSLEKFYPELKNMELSDYKVRVLPGAPGTGAKVRVLIESTDGQDHWGTVGVSHDIIEASWQALVDSYNYKMYKAEKTNGVRKPGRGKKDGTVTPLSVISLPSPPWRDLESYQVSKPGSAIIPGQFDVAFSRYGPALRPGAFSTHASFPVSYPRAAGGLHLLVGHIRDNIYPQIEWIYLQQP